MTRQPQSDQLLCDGASFRAAQVDHLYSQGIAGIRGSIIAAVIMTVFLWDSISHLRLIIWLACYVSACGIGEFLFREFHRPSVVCPGANWRSLFVALSITGGALWGLTPILLFPVDSIQDQALMTFVLGGMSIGISISHGAIKSAHIPFILLVYLPLIGRYFYEGTHVQVTMGVLLAIFMIYLLGAAHRMHAMVMESLTLRFQNQGLVEMLTHQQEELKASLAEKDVLLREVHHRVKNNLQIISSLFRLQSRYSDKKSLETVLADSQNRLLSMALVHEKLYQSGDKAHIDFAPYLDKLIKRLFQSNSSPEKHITYQQIGDSVLIPLDMAIPCGLILTEIVSNSLKHAFPDGKKGQITISLTHSEDAIELVVADNGIGLPSRIDLGNRQTLGLHLVETLVKQLKGNITISRSQGTKFIMRFPAPKTVDGALK